MMMQEFDIYNSLFHVLKVSSSILAAGETRGDVCQEARCLLNTLCLALVFGYTVQFYSCRLSGPSTKTSCESLYSRFETYRMLKVSCNKAAAYRA